MRTKHRTQLLNAPFVIIIILLGILRVIVFRNRFEMYVIFVFRKPIITSQFSRVLFILRMEIRLIEKNINIYMIYKRFDMVVVRATIASDVHVDGEWVRELNKPVEKKWKTKC